MYVSNNVEYYRQLYTEGGIEMGKKLDVDGWTINDIMDLYKEDALFVDQRYQRKLVWKKVEESHKLAHLNKLSKAGNFLKCYRVKKLD